MSDLPPSNSPSQLSPAQARPLAERFARGLALQWAMRLKMPQGLAGLVDGGLIAYPVWVGFLRSGRRQKLRAIDALNAEPWAGKLRRMLLPAFRRLESPDQPPGPVTEPREQQPH